MDYLDIRKTKAALEFYVAEHNYELVTVTTNRSGYPAGLHHAIIGFETFGAAKEAAKLSYTKEELRLLSALIFCEAGSEPYAGKVAVGIVVMNRVESRLFPGSLKDVIYQKYQFGPARNGSLSKALAAYDAGKFTATNHKESIEAAKAALEGAKSVTYNGKNIDMKSTLYFSGRVSGAKFTIAHHQFK